MKKINDKELDQVSGGIIVPPADDGYMETNNTTTYSSGPTPKYRVGQNLKIVYTVCQNNYYCGCTVESVSSSANCGWFYKEFGYTVRILDAPPEVLRYSQVVGEVYSGVYESCLYDK